MRLFPRILRKATRPSAESFDSEGRLRFVLMEEHGGVTFCKMCRDPLDYPGVMIPDGPPQAKPFSGPRGKQLIKWHWNRSYYCITCARTKLRGMSREDLLADPIRVK